MWHRQHRAKQSRQVLHETALATEHRRLSDELSLDSRAQFEHLRQLRVGTGVKGCVQTTRGRVLRQLMLWRIERTPGHALR